MKARRFCVLFAMLIVVTLLTAGCGGAATEVPEVAQPQGESGEQAPAAEPVTLQFLGCSYVGEGLQPVFDAFEASHPGISIEFQAVPFDNLNDVLTASLAEGSATPDVFWADQPRIPALAERGYLLDLSEYLADYEGKVFEGTIVESTWDGKLYALPMSTSSLMMFYNIDLLEAADVELPSTDPADRWTWDETLEAARAAKAAGATYGLVFDQVDRYYQLQPLVESAGGGSGLTGEDNLTPDVTNEGWLKAMQFYHDIHEEGLSPRGVSWEQIPELFNTGHIAIYITGPWSALYAVGYDDLHYGIAPHPYFAGGKQVTATGSWSIGINPNSAHVAEAIEFARYLTLDPQASLIYNQVEGSPATLLEAYTAFWDQDAFKTQPTLSEIDDLMAYEQNNTAIPRPRSVGYLQLETIMGTAFSDIRNGLDPTEVLTQTQKQLVEAFSQIK